MKTSELREKSLDELNALEQSYGEEVFKLRMQHGMRKLTQTHQLTQIRRQIARVKTVITEKTRNSA